MDLLQTSCAKHRSTCLCTVCHLVQQCDYTVSALTEFEFCEKFSVVGTDAVSGLQEINKSDTMSRSIPKFVGYKGTLVVFCVFLTNALQYTLVISLSVMIQMSLMRGEVPASDIISALSSSAVMYLQPQLSESRPSNLSHLIIVANNFPLSILNICHSLGFSPCHSPSDRALSFRLELCLLQDDSMHFLHIYSRGLFPVISKWTLSFGVVSLGLQCVQQ